MTVLTIKCCKSIPNLMHFDAGVVNFYNETDGTVFIGPLCILQNRIHRIIFNWLRIIMLVIEIDSNGLDM